METLRLLKGRHTTIFSPKIDSFGHVVPDTSTSILVRAGTVFTLGVENVPDLRAIWTCEKSVSRGWCHRHYRNWGWSRKGNEMIGK